MPSDLHGPYRAARDGEEQFADELEQLMCEIKDNPHAYVRDWIADPSELVAHIWRICAGSADETEVGRLIRRTAFLPQVRGVAAYKSEG